MSRYHLGEFEEIVLLTIGILYGNAYGIAILDEIEDRLKRKVSIGSLQTVLGRLEKKGYLTSELGESTPERGGKRKRYYTVTKYGQKVLIETRDQRQALWDDIPGFAFE
ncbi:MAG: helix-turn-helix transcriptional regulator [Saprospiraceae bacterium]|nr:helix-turn-helix transcriptional regulator [Saprospiraceae bacterium]